MYQSRISGPLLDRIDIQLEVAEVSYDEIQQSDDSIEKSEAIRKRVELCRQIQLERFKGRNLRCNAEMGVPEIRRYCELTPDGHALMQRIIDRLGMSARAHHRILKVARTLADMDGAESIATSHLSEAISYRTLDKKLIRNT